MEKIEKRPEKISFKKAWIDFFVGFVDFKGRSTRLGFWWVQSIVFFIFLLIGNVFSNQISNQLTGIVYKNSGAMSPREYGWMIFSFFLYVVLDLTIIIGLSISSLSLTVRRLRDIGIRGRGQLVIFILLYFLNLALYSKVYMVVVENGKDFLATYLSQIFSAIEIIILSVLPTGIFATNKKSGVLAFFFEKKGYFKEDL